MSMLSRADNCIFYNCLFNSGVKYTSDDLLLLQKLRMSMPQDMVNDYYIKSASIIEVLNTRNMNNKDTWSHIDVAYVNPILSSLNTEEVAKVIDMTRYMIDDLEKKLGI